MSKFIDITGFNFGYLTVIERDTNKSKRTKWICKCKCGNTVSVYGTQLRNGNTKSCGCKRYESHNSIHGLTKSRPYYIWSSMKDRCLNKNAVDFHRYGGRKITVCDEWKNDFLSFYNWAINNGYDETKTIDRIDVDGNYEPNNCRWVTHRTQQLNRTNTVYVFVDGEKRTLFELCEERNFSYKLAHARYRTALKKGMNISVDEIFKERNFESHSTKKRVVNQYTKDGIFIRSWSYLKSVEDGGFNYRSVLACCQGKNRTSGGFVWKYD